ncbi:MAG TPA: DUF305 domain-containing protein [Acidimicrobiia bacterium]|nr:DUF305 domain-containing protein [Acidimicrobiia bacterium]
MKDSYQKLGIAVGINTVVMFILTYALIDSFDHFYPNLNRGYMALMMSAPMVIVMLAVMGAMYPDRRLNLGLMATAGAVFVLVFSLARTQTPIGDDQFLRSMIPHHSSAIVMCEESSISDPEIEALCTEIVATQEREIAEMTRLLAES